MSLFLRAKNNQFKFLFPKDFLFEDVTNKYTESLKVLPISYKNVIDFLNSSIQSISFPGLQKVADVSQISKARKISWRDGSKFDMDINKDFSITFSLLDSYLNYWIMYDQLINFLDFNCAIEYFPEFNIFYLENSGEVKIEQKLKNILYLGITDLTPSYTDTSVSSKTFTCYFKFNYFDINIHPVGNSSQKNLLH